MRKGVYLLILTLLACNGKEHNSAANQEIVLKDIQNIVDKYDLDEGSITITPNTNDPNLRNIDLEEFETLAANLADYQKSKEGIMAKKLNEFAIKKRKENLPKEEVDKFYKNFDAKFGTNYFERFNSKKPEGTIIINTLDMTEREFDSFQKVQKTLSEKAIQNHK